MRTLKQKIDVELKDACVGWEWMGVKNAYPSSESASKMLLGTSLTGMALGAGSACVISSKEAGR